MASFWFAALLLPTLVFATCQAGSLSYIPSGHSSTVHNSPSAVSHQTFTRLSSEPDVRTTRILTAPAALPVITAAAAYNLPPAPPRPPMATAYQSVSLSSYRTPPYGSVNPPSGVDRKSGTPVVETLTRTPAHLAYSARPIVYKMLPQPKPVRSISYDSLRAGGARGSPFPHPSVPHPSGPFRFGQS